MCMEPLIRNIKNNISIEPITSRLIGEVQIPKIFGFADDINALVKRNDSVKLIFKEYERLSLQSGLVLNASKTEILCFNHRRQTGINFNIEYMGTNYVLQGQEQVKIN